MSSGYYYNNINIANLIQTGSTPVPGFGGFPQSTPFQYSSGFDKPANFSYTYQGTDISNYTTANMFLSTSNTNSGNIPLQIGNSNSYFNIVSVCGSGGGGGGGGGGNYYELDGVGYYDGGNGGAGGAGAYGAVLNYHVSGATNISYNVGTGGIGENGTGKSGNNTSVSVGNTTIISCDGNGSPGAYNGKNGDSGNTPDSTVVSGNITTNTSGYPPQNGTGWTSGGGGGGGNSTDKSFNSGTPGNTGFVLVYFSI